jgi:hypothetical protein
MAVAVAVAACCPAPEFISATAYSRVQPFPGIGSSASVCRRRCAARGRLIPRGGDGRPTAEDLNPHFPLPASFSLVHPLAPLVVVLVAISAAPAFLRLSSTIRQDLRQRAHGIAGRYALLSPLFARLRLVSLFSPCFLALVSSTSGEAMILLSWWKTRPLLWVAPDGLRNRLYGQCLSH